jgi:hypothetical protein
MSTSDSGLARLRGNPNDKHCRSGAYPGFRCAPSATRHSLRLPRDPSPAKPNTPGKSYQFQLNGTFWLGMALCDTPSYPERVSTRTPDSDTNIADPAVSPNHPGTAFLELPPDHNLVRA